ncbi:MAG TPA: endolytic transglycosylase MltG, partial [Rubrobacter sp.]|nr:endolytic transglycosylase MltG [Rubrobacter sp.]
MRRRRKCRSNVGPTVLGLLLLVGVVAAVYFIYTSAVAGDADEAERPVSVEVVKGDTLSTVAAKLERAGVIQSALVFKVAARVDGNSDTSIKTGKYTFDPGADTDAILSKLTAGRAVPSVSVTLPEGLTLPETARAVAEGTEIPAGEFESAARRTDYGYAFLEDEAIETTEGYLFPRRYDFEEGVTARQVVDRMLEQYLI